MKQDLRKVKILQNGCPRPLIWSFHVALSLLGEYLWSVCVQLLPLLFIGLTFYVDWVIIQEGPWSSKVADNFVRVGIVWCKYISHCSRRDCSSLQFHIVEMEIIVLTLQCEGKKIPGSVCFLSLLMLKSVGTARAFPAAEGHDVTGLVSRKPWDLRTPAEDSGYCCCELLTVNGCLG